MMNYKEIFENSDCDGRFYIGAFADNPMDKTIFISLHGNTRTKKDDEFLYRGLQFTVVGDCSMNVYEIIDPISAKFRGSYQIIVKYSNKMPKIIDFLHNDVTFQSKYTPFD